MFITGTRADFGKMKPLIARAEQENSIEAHVFVTGMHTLKKYGWTYREVEKADFQHIHQYINQRDSTEMDLVLSNTIRGLSNFVNQLEPDMIVVHGDRVEALAGAIVGSFNNILVGHVEGGEVSGTIDEPIRHSVTKLSHLHFVSTADAAKRVEQLGEDSDKIFEIGSPDIDVMLSEDLPGLDETKEHYEIEFDEYAILLYHPVTTRVDEIEENVSELVAAVQDSGRNYVVIDPNNDKGNEKILEAYEQLEGECFRRFPSVRFEYFLTLLKNAAFIIGNSSAGIRESEVYGVPSINIGDRQQGRYASGAIIDIPHNRDAIVEAIDSVEELEVEPQAYFGDANSAEKFINILQKDAIWETDAQKKFVDRFEI